MASLPRLRPATAEEIKLIASESDLGAGTSVLALDNPEGKPDFVVLRQCLEVDPVHYADTSNHRRRATLISLVENALAFSGVREYYFNVPASEEMAKYREIATNWGAEATSKEPEIRFKKRL